LFGHLAGGNSFPKPLSANEEKKCLKLYAEGNEDAKNTLIEHNLRLVPYVAKKYTNHAKYAEDLLSVGTIGLIKAILAYDHEKGARLSTYAIRCIDNEILMFIRGIKKTAGDVYMQDVLGTDREGNEVCIEDKLADEIIFLSLIQCEKSCEQRKKGLLQNRENGCSAYPLATSYPCPSGINSRKVSPKASANDTLSL
jgi:RNA polymerase sporulation-specific sigma factor